MRAEVKALACELPSERGLPLSRFSSAEIAREAVARGITCELSGTTVWRWLCEDAIRPWHYRSWIFSRDPDFRAKAARVLDLYAGRCAGKLLRPGEFVLCADEKPSIQARARTHETLSPAPAGDGQLVEHEYERMGALCYLAAWDVRRAHLFDRCEARGGIEPFDRLVAQVMSQEPYASARRVFWIVDNGSSHRGRRSVERLQGSYANLVLIHLPIHASWLNQVEIYFSIVQRKVLQPNDFADLAAVERRLLAFGRHYQQIAKPFAWTPPDRNLAHRGRGSYLTHWLVRFPLEIGSMELNGALSNPLARGKAPLSAVLELHAELLGRPPAASIAGSRSVLKARPTRVKELVEQIVSEAAGPLRVRDVTETLADRTDMCVDPASIRKTLHDGTRGPAPRFHRVGWGLYTTAIQEIKPASGPGRSNRT